MAAPIPSQAAEADPPGMTPDQARRCRAAMGQLHGADDQRYRDLLLMHVADQTRLVMRDVVQNPSRSALTARQLLAADTDRDLLIHEHRAWLRLAIVFFLLVDEAQDDFADSDCTGPDAEVVANVLEAIGRADLARPLRAWHEQNP
jgi:hypothetical protein